MVHYRTTTVLIATLAPLLAAAPAAAFDSGSPGGPPLNPTANVEIPLPLSGVLDYDSINIPLGVRVTFLRNATNTPVIIRVKGSAMIIGTIDVSGQDAPATGSIGNGAQNDDGAPGRGGPGGYDGGRGSATGKGVQTGGTGIGPGGGGPGLSITCTSGSSSNTYSFGGAGGGYSAAGTNGGGFSLSCGTGQPTYPPATGGSAYGSPELLPLIGGSGGGGGGGWFNFRGGGGGGGGGAILIAVTGSLTVQGNGQILANGGRGGDVGGTGAGSVGGGGSGGAIRLVASSLTIDGRVWALAGGAGGQTVATGASNYGGGSGSQGRIRLEADTVVRVGGNIQPAYGSVAKPGAIFITGLPTLRIARVAGTPVPAAPTGSRDVVLPASLPNPVAVDFETSGIPAGNTVVLTVTPPTGAAYSKRSPALVQDGEVARASVSLDIPTGDSTLTATTTYQIVVGLGESLSRYAMGERVERIRVSASLAGESAITLITVSGREFDLPREQWSALMVAG
jgi:hypothetical protein